MINKINLFFDMFSYKDNSISFFQHTPNKKFIKNSKIFDCFINSKYKLIYKTYD